ncbi:inositol monophosphatase family protein [Streptomyces aidingensis]|uniref:inositol-phosphate phosphatase n=1 Tax=Streptomyces aidingensis TaxID=910347 RepID=A0A1I1J447_9ACTN|nr:inositol monophosphatase [Streptomyces aidingensis]SFC40230.1 fructose-1,6-bisphosphatase [Streptomyces aidingensis]
MIDEELAARAEDAVRRAAAVEIMPRWRQLAEDEVSSKSGPHDVVTVADRQAERLLTDALTALLPGSLVVGEEGVYEDPASYDALRGGAPVWIIDPVDGTRQFVRGGPGFCTLLTLAQHGRLLASWTYLPAQDLMATARRGAGAWLNGERLRAGSPAPGASLDIALTHPDFATEEHQKIMAALYTPGFEPRPSGSVGVEYLRVARGHLDALVYTWEKAWDHAAGLLLVAEAGGVALAADGSPYRITGGNALPFTAARDEHTARRILTVLAAARPDSA